MVLGGNAMHARKLWAPAVAVALLGGCSALPDFRHQGSVSSEDIVRHVQCELQAAYALLRPTYPVLDKWAAAYKVTFRAERQHSGGLASGTWTVPGGVSVGAAATLSSSRLRQGSVRYQTRFDRIGEFNCDSDRKNSDRTDGPGGDLRIAEWLSSALAPSHDAAAVVPAELTYLINFVAKYDASLRPTFVIVNLTGSPLLGGGHSNSDSLDIAFLDVSQKAKPRPTEIVIVSWPPGLSTSGAVPESLVAPPVAPARVVSDSALPADVQDRLDELLDSNSSE